jgi:hypothetical protein
MHHNFHGPVKIDRIRGTRVLDATPARPPLSIMFFGRPFSEPTLFKIAAAYEAATHHRESPPDFGTLQR